MDILTPKGQETLKQEQRAMEIINLPYIETNKESPADVDGFIYDDSIRAVYEVKCRNATYERMKEWGSWIITQDKVYRGSHIAKSLCVPFIGILYLIPDDMVLMFTLADKYGNMLYERAEHTQTKETINGGQKVRYNAFYDINKAKIWTQKN